MSLSSKSASFPSGSSTPSLDTPWASISSRASNNSPELVQAKCTSRPNTDSPVYATNKGATHAVDFEQHVRYRVGHTPLSPHHLRRDRVLWWRLHVFLWDLGLSITPDEPTQGDLKPLTATDFFQAPYFRGGHALIMRQVGCMRTGEKLVSVVQRHLTVQHGDKLVAKCRRLVRADERKPASLHTLSRIIARALGIELKKFINDERFYSLVLTHGLNAPPQWSGFAQCQEEAIERFGDVIEKSALRIRPTLGPAKCNVRLGGAE